MKFHVTGADKETGNDIEIDVTASDRAEAETVASKRGVLVCAVAPVKDADPEQIDLADIPLVDDKKSSGTVAGAKVGTIAGAKVGTMAGGKAATVAGAPSPAASVAGAAANHASAAGASGISMNPGSPSATAGPSESMAPLGSASTAQAGAHMEYHVIMNQSLYLLEVAVNKHIKDGWEPQGGLTIGVWNNAMQYFQAVIRHKD